MEITLLQNPAAFWLMLGILLALSELFVPGLVILFFGLGALITSGICYLADISITLQVVVFLFTSILSLLIFRSVLKQRFFSDTEEKDESLNGEFIGKTARVSRVNEDGVSGQIEFRGTVWTIQSNEVLSVGDVVEITSKESIKLFVTKKTNT
ncbi:MAG: NfeD family protein [Bacteroidetes bacterium]|nr:NfeD family protein [Bacteroidota bacterium]